MAAPPQASSEDITFVLTSCGRFDLLRETLDTFFRWNSASLRRCLLIEDSGKREVIDVVRNHPVDVIINDPPLGQIRSIDRAYASIDTPYVFHCEDDWRFFRSGFIEESLVLLRNDPHVSVVSCRSLAQNPSLEPLKELPVRSIGGVEFRISPVWRHRIWDGYTFNPGLRRLSDYRAMESFGKWGHEAEVSQYFKRKGMAVAHLANPACETTGSERRLRKQKPARNLRVLAHRRISDAQYLWHNLVGRGH